MWPTASSTASRATGRFSSALSMPPRSLLSSNGTRRSSLLTTSGITSSAVSKVVKRSPQCQALAPPADLRAFGRQPRVVDLGVVVRAEGTVHGTPS